VLEVLIVFLTGPSTYLNYTETIQNILCALNILASRYCLTLEGGDGFGHLVLQSALGELTPTNWQCRALYGDQTYIVEHNVSRITTTTLHCLRCEYDRG